MSKLLRSELVPWSNTETGEAAVSSAVAQTPHPHDRVFSGLFGNGRVVELLKNADGYAYGHRIQFENGMNAELLITGVATRH